MPFVTSFPQTALSTIIGEVTKAETPNVGRLALAAYDLVGFGLFEAFGDEKYLMAMDLTALATTADILSAFDPDTIALLKGLPWLAIAQDAYAWYTAGNKPYTIVTKLAFKYGMSLLPVLSKVVALVEKLRG